jgi:predicted Zn-dependent protease
LNKVNDWVQKGEYQKAKAIIDDLPVNLKLLKMVQIRDIQVSAQISDSLYYDAVDKFHRDFPGDPSLDIVLLNSYFDKKQYEEALACINRLDKRIDTDPFLDYYRSLIYNAMNKKAEAQQILEKLYKNLPDFSTGAMELSTYYMDKNEYEKAVGIINKVKQNRDFDKAQLENLYLLYPRLKSLMEK